MMAPRTSLDGLRRAPAHGATTPISAGFSEGCGHRGVFSVTAPDGAMRAPSVGHLGLIRPFAVEVCHSEAVGTRLLNGGGLVVVRNLRRRVKLGEGGEIGVVVDLA